MLLIGFVQFLLMVFLNGQAPDTLWTKTYGGANIDVGHAVKRTSDGGYIISGWTYSYGNGGSDVSIIKTDDSGNVLWTKVYGGSLNDGGDDIVETPDGSYIIVGLTYSYGSGGSDVLLMKIDSTGDTVWVKTYGGNDDDMGNSIQQTFDGGYVIAGKTHSFSAGLDNVYLIKIDEYGDTLWTRIFGGDKNDICFAVQETSDSGFILTGKTESFGAQNYDCYLAKTDSDGNLLWSKTYGGFSNDYAYSVQEISNGGYIIAGHTRSFGSGSWDVYLVKTNSVGDTVWTKTCGGIHADEAFSIIETSDGDYIIAGATHSFGAGISDVYVIKTDKDGNIIWTGTYGGSKEDWGYSIQQTPDGGYIIIGYTESFGAGYINVYLIKTENDAGIEYEKEQNQKPRVGLQLNVYPNPFTTSTTIYFPSIEHRAESIELDIYDVSGRRVRDFILYPSSFILPAVAWDGKDDEGRALPPGTYFIRINEHLQQKIIKLR